MSEGKFLFGYKDKDDVLHTDFEYTGLNGMVEEALGKPEVRTNGGKTIHTLLEMCLTRIGTIEKSSVKPSEWKNIVRNLYVGDQDVAMLKIREESFGEDIEVVHRCPDCKAQMKTIIKTTEVPIIEYNETEYIPFELPVGYKDKNGTLHQTGTIRRPIGEDREILDPILRKNPGLANTMMLTRCMKFDDNYSVTDIVTRNLMSKDRTYLMGLLNDNRFGVDLDLEVFCTSCGETFTGSLNALNFI